jgi:hypothetical protein
MGDLTGCKMSEAYDNIVDFTQSRRVKCEPKFTVGGIGQIPQSSI